MWLYIIIAVLVVCLIVSICINIRSKKEMQTLSKSIERFIEYGESTAFSTRSDSVSVLQNSIVDLENCLTVEKGNTLEKEKENTEFIADVSHQLKTPLAGLRLYCEMEQSENPNVYAEKELILIGKMEKLIQKLLRLQKIKSDSYTMDFQMNDMGVIVRECISLICPNFPSKNYTVLGGGEMRCDRAWISEAIGNVIKNASEHTADDGSVTVLIENDDDFLTLKIKDNGGGIEPSEIPKLFSRFHKTENSAKDSVGIGLSITKAITQKHHGTILAENSNEGLCVTMCFPHIDGQLKIN